MPRVYLIGNTDREVFKISVKGTIGHTNINKVNKVK